jgi:two-component system sensor histidine kinase UhpB
MRKLIPIFLWGRYVLIIILPINLFCQTIPPPKDSAKIWKLLDFADALIEKCQFDSAILYAEHAKNQSRTNQFKRGEAYALLKLAEIYYNKSEYLQLGALDSAALNIGKYLNDTSLIARSYYQLGQFFQANESYDAAEQMFNKALSIKYEKEQSEYTGYILNDMGTLYGSKGLASKQLEWYLKAVRIHQKNNNEFGLAQTYSNMNDYYYEHDQFEQAISYGKLSFQLREKINDYAGLANSCNNLSQTYLRIDSIQAAIKYQELGLKYATLSGLPSRIAHSYVSMSLLMNQQKKFREALDYEKKAIDLYAKVDRNVQSNRYIAAAFYSNILNDSAEAISYFRKSEALARELNDKIVLRNVYQYMSDFYRVRKNMQLAYDYYKKYYVYRDSLNNVEVNKKIFELQTQYETEKKDYEIIKLTTEQKIRNLEIERQKAVIAGNEALARKKTNEIELLSRYKELQEIKIKRQDEQLEKQLLLAKNKEQQLQLSEKENLLQLKKLKETRTTKNILLLSFISAVLMGFFIFNRYQLKRKIKEQEMLLSVRENIAKDLHDEIGSTLTSIRILSEVTGRALHQDGSKASELLNKISAQSYKIQQSMSDIVWAINPGNDKMKDIVVRMREYVAETLEAKDIKTFMNIDEDILNQRLDMGQRRNLLLIFKEALNNISKYAHASKVDIELGSKDHVFFLRIKDNGIGFDVHKVRSSSGQKNMQSRAAAMNGSCNISSVTGEGTEVLTKIPLSS